MIVEANFTVVKNNFDKANFPYEAACLQYKNSGIYFLYSDIGNAVSLHVKAISKNDKLKLRQAGRDILKYIKEKNPETKMVIAKIKKRTVFNLCQKLGFDYLGKKEDANNNKFHIMVYNYERSI